MSAIVVGVGTNLGAREAAIRAAAMLLDARPGLRLVRESPLYETEPLGPPQGRFLNAALRFDTTLSPPDVLSALLRTERRLGRVRDPLQRWGPRSVDLDLLWDSRGPFESSHLRVPHPELANRSFALGPAMDVAPELHPALGAALSELGKPEVWSRPAIVRERRRQGVVEIEVESDSEVDACALATRLRAPSERPWSTRHAVLDPSPESLEAALRASLRRGFAVHQATVSHCSPAQWIVQFHGVGTPRSREADVRLRTTSGRHRAARVTLEARIG
jgi:2-amino-4-hydroxy-6-hydroxymethyldihydropteridine diphosphokinase